MRIIRVERIRDQENPDKAPLWMVGFTDLTTILLAFFILLFSTAQPKKDWNEASQSLRSSFGGNEHAIALRGEAGAGEAEKTWQQDDRNPGLNLDYLSSIVKKYIRSEPALQSVKVLRDGDTVILAFDEELGFGPGQSDVSTEGRAILNKLVPLLSRLPNRLEVMGHADSTPVYADSRFNSNWQLSLLRAVSVAEALARAGYDRPIDQKGRGTVEGEGKEKAVARRVDLRLYMVHP